MNDELEITWIGMLMACVRVLYRHSPAGTEENFDEPVRIVGAKHLGNTSQKGYRLNQLARSAPCCVTPA
jgi:hypothetical protein